MAEPTTTLDSLAQQSPAGELAAEQRFAVVPEWMLDADVSDAAFRLYAVLARYGNTSGVRMPGRALLARRLRKSVDTVDRALRELTAAGVLEVERRHDGNRHLTNRYHLRTVDPASSSRTDAATPSPESQVDRTGGHGAAPAPERGSMAAVLRLPLAAPMRPGWPHPCGPTQTFLPRQAHPPPRLPRRSSRRRRIRTANCSTPAAFPTSTPTPPRSNGSAATSANPQSGGQGPV